MKGNVLIKSNHHEFEIKRNVLNNHIFENQVEVATSEGPWCDRMSLAKKSSARSNADEFLGISKHGSCYHGLFRRCMPRFTALQKGSENHGWNHDFVKCAFMSCILNGSQKAYSYVSLFDLFHLFQHRSSPLPPSWLRMKRGS